VERAHITIRSAGWVGHWPSAAQCTSQSVSKAANALVTNGSEVEHAITTGFLAFISLLLHAIGRSFCATARGGLVSTSVVVRSVLGQGLDCVQVRLGTRSVRL